MNKGDVNYGAFYTTKEFQLHGTAIEWSVL